MKYDQHGRELPDDTPVEAPVGLKRPPTLHEMIAMHVRSAVFAQRAGEAGMETEEEANDFDLDGDDDEELPVTPYEMKVMVEEDVDREKRGRAVRKREERVQGDAAPGSVRSGEERKDVSRKDAGGGSSSVQSVEQASEVRKGDSGGA